MKPQRFWVVVAAAVGIGLIVRSAHAFDVQQAATAVAALPESTPAEHIKKCILGVDVEFARSAIAVGDEPYAGTLLDDVQHALSDPADQIGRLSSDARQISALAPVAESTNNPYIAQITSGAQKFLASNDEPLGKSTEQVDAVDPDPQHMQSRAVAFRMRALMWLYFNPASPLRGDTRILERLFRRVLAYSDALDVHAEKLAPGKSILDDFAISPAACSLREFAALMPDALLPSQKQQLARAMRKAADKMNTKAESMRSAFKVVYPNIELALSFELLNFGWFLHDQALLDRSKSLIDDLEPCFYPAGAVAYIGAQNECANYQDTISSFLADTYLLSGDPRCIEWLKRMEWYGPVSLGKMLEFWTAPSWKHQWNSTDNVGAVGGEAVVSLTGNPYARGMLPPPVPQDGVDKQWDQHLIDIPFYRSGIAARPLPDNYVALDQNIDGPRAWYGNFTYAATLRLIPVEQPGLTTIMGCMTLDEHGMYDAIMLSAGVRANLPDGKTVATLTSGMKRAMIVGTQFSACGAQYDLAVPRSATKGPVVPWLGRQVWIGLPDRVIGLLAVMPADASAGAGSVESFVQLGTGGTVTGKPEKLLPAQQDAFDYGRLRVSILGGNMGPTQSREVPFRIPRAPITELYRSSASTGPGEPSWSIVEVADRDAAATPAVVSAANCTRESAGFGVKVGEKSYQLLYNCGDHAISPDATGIDSSRMLFVSDPQGRASVGQSISFPHLSIQPGQIMAAVEGASEAAGRTTLEVLEAAR